MNLISIQQRIGDDPKQAVKPGRIREIVETGDYSGPIDFKRQIDRAYDWELDTAM